MFKVDFMKDDRYLNKTVLKSAPKTEVVLSGIVQMPFFWDCIPMYVRAFIFMPRKHLTISRSQGAFQVHSVGKAVCSEQDKYNPILGERIAESKAKYQIYKFFYSLTRMLCDYYGEALYGSQGAIVDCTKEGLMGDMKKYERLCIHESKHLGELLSQINDGSNK